MLKQIPHPSLLRLLRLLAIFCILVLVSFLLISASTLSLVLFAPAAVAAGGFVKLSCLFKTCQQNIDKLFYYLSVFGITGLIQLVIMTLMFDMLIQKYKNKKTKI